MPVLSSADFRRVFNLPRRSQQWDKETEEEGIETLTTWLKTKTGTMRLRPIQARCLLELLEYRQLFGMVGTGHGKTLISLLAPVVFEAQRPLLLVPANLVEKTLDDQRELSKHWNIHPNIYILTYDKLSRVQYATILNQYNPDLIIADEAHKAGNPFSARGRRFFRYINKTPGCTFVPLSGTFMRRKIKDMAYLMQAAMKKNAPIPDNKDDLDSWHFALSEGIPDAKRQSGGVLWQFCTEEERKVGGIDALRKGFMRRVLETPGVVATTEASSDVPLIIQVRDITTPDPVKQALDELRDTGRLPTGDTVNSPLRLWEASRQVISGFTYKWDPPAPAEWLKARQDWNTFVNACIEKPPKGLTCDSPLEVWNLCDRGLLKDPSFETWNQIKRSFKPNPVPVWIDKYMIEDAQQWALDNKAIVWVGYSSAYTKDLEVTNEQTEAVFKDAFDKIPYFGPGDDRIMKYKGPCAASINAHGTGKNLVQWDTCLIMLLPSSGVTLEQLIARHHRIGQESDEVRVFFYCHQVELIKSLETVQKDARFIETTSGNGQKILYGDLLDSDGHRLNLAKLEERISAKPKTTGRPKRS